MVRDYISFKRNLVLLVVSARSQDATHIAPAMIQEHLSGDPALAKRVVGVFTHPDLAQDPTEVLRALSGELFAGESNRYGTLRSTLKDALWNHTITELPSLIEDDGEEIADAEHAIAGLSQPRHNESTQRDYLHFQRLVREAVDGSYRNEGCKRDHLIGEEDRCLDCRPFFAAFGNHDKESQDKRLCSKVRGLCRAFTMAIQRYGRRESVRTFVELALGASLRDEYEKMAAGKLGDFDRWYQGVGNMLLNTFLPQSGVVINEFITGQLADMVRGTLTGKSASVDIKPDVRKVPLRWAGTSNKSAAKRVIEYVETYYEMSMLAFVGYVNALVEESSIVQKLPNGILTRALIQALDVQSLKTISGEKENVIQKRAQKECHLKALREIQVTLKRFLMGE
ncbi:unnamed protein product [Parascedosporium putredinis]|uniref:GED domain-containing protein n=1 Tax=Parascedosporium putredinis TaxID=1442378 RepID=A0A9P1H4V8_9PEZI|nr:unnamed protein product [Parascedosporium putredinis]CAI7996983.1 unnamed protein product [Parascedosporium putredinis]